MSNRTAAVSPVVTLLSHTPEPEKVVALAAKLCYSDADVTELRRGVSETDTAKFIAMLIRLGHLSTIEHASFTFSIEGVSRALLAQITRHRIASFSVKSQRYVGADKSFRYVMPPAVAALGQAAADRFHAQMEQMRAWYLEWQGLLGEGEHANEDARFVLPNAAETKMLVTMNARELRHFFALRCCNRAQWEIRAVAWQMLESCLAVAPNLFANAGAPCFETGVCGEGKKSCGRPDEVRARHKALAAAANNNQGV